MVKHITFCNIIGANQMGTFIFIIPNLVQNEDTIEFCHNYDCVKPYSQTRFIKIENLYIL